MEAGTADLVFRSATDLADLVREGQVSARDLVQTSLDAISDLDPNINATVGDTQNEG